MLYLHIPFCKRRCIYCDFFSTTQGEDVRRRFVERACRELEERADYLPTRTLHSIYFGGGTPSQLSLQEIEQLLSSIHAHYDVADDAEITFEANPDDVRGEWVRTLRALGINRMSLGVQSFDDALLRLLNRRHDSQQARRAVEAIMKNGIENVSIDLIYGLPEQTRTSFQADIQEAFALPVTHLSSYALSVEAGTALGKMVESGALRPADEETCRAEYEALLEAADQHGFEHYEISNFARPGFQARHNSGYWDGTPYLGIGPGAHSYDGCTRRYNHPDLLLYIEALDDVPHTVENLTPQERYDELVFTALRTARGLDTASVERLFGTEALHHLRRCAAPHLAAGRLLEAGRRIKLAREAIFISDNIISDLMMA